MSKEFKDALAQVIGAVEVDGKEVPVLQVDAVSSQIRQSITQVLRVTDPEGYAEYRKIKYANGDEPSLTDRKAAYRFAFRRFLNATYRFANF